MHEANIGQYRILRSIGKGGMGEVLLAYDPVCEREVALKLMRTEWVGKPGMIERFLKEARTAAQLSHPSIIPIYSIHENEKSSFYTMPQIEGETLKSILRTSLHPTCGSIPALMRIFLSICSAIAFAHSKKILHRDLKPENIIIGKYGEVILLDWGLAEIIGESKEENRSIPGTIAYMAPELAFGECASIQTDIYALGVILYQILALRLPFHRTTLKHFRQTFEREEWVDPQELAPERDITLLLSQICKKCLAVSKRERYQTVEELINDVERYIEGLPEWGESTLLHVETKEDWAFQENVALARHMAISREADLLLWVNWMMARRAFPGNLKIELEFELGKSSQGFGLLFCVPDNKERKNLESGCCLWVGSHFRLYRSGVEVWNDPSISIIPDKLYKLKIEKIENQINIYLDGTLHLRFHSHISLTGTQVGLMLRDGDLKLSPIEVALGSQHAMVNCLAVPDAFLGRKLYAEALVEYRKIASSFSGRAEGREATFRAGLTLLEKAKSARQKKQREQLLAEALEEFSKLHSTPGAPLEYVGKALVYNYSGEIDEEAKCLELALRKFSHHPLKPIVVEHLISRLHACAQSNRYAAYHLAFLTLRHLPDFFKGVEGQEILNLLEKHLEPLPFLHLTERRDISVALQLAFWLGRPLAIAEMIEQGLEPLELENAQMLLIQLKEEKLIKSPQSEEIRWLLGQSPMPQNPSFSACIVHFDRTYPKYESFAIEGNDPHFFLPSLKIWGLLLQSKWEEASAIFNALPSDLSVRETHPLFFLRGCLLMGLGKREEAMSHLLSISESASPPTSALLSNYLLGRIAQTGKWAYQAFFWERYKLLQQLLLFSHCSGQKKPFLWTRLANLRLEEL